MFFESLWTKSTFGALLGFVLSMSLLLNLGSVFPSRQGFLIVLVFGLVAIWGAFVTWFFCVKSVKQPFLICTGALVLSLGLNAFLYMGVPS